MTNQKNNFNYLYFISFLFLFVLLFEVGCMHSGYGTDISLNKENLQVLESNLEIASNNKYDKQLGEFRLLINKESLNDYLISVTRHSSLLESFPFSQYFEKISDQYSVNIKLLSKNPNAITQKPAEFSFNTINKETGKSYFLAKKDNGNESWKLLKPVSSNSSNLLFYTHTFSDWILLKEKQQSNILKNPTITSNLVYSNNEHSNFNNDLEIKICIPNCPGNKANLKLFGRGNFPLNYNSIIPAATNSYNINLQSLEFPETSNDLATYSLTLKMTDYAPIDMKKTENFIIAQAEYTDSNNICYISQKKIDFEIIPNNQELNSITVKSYTPSQNSKISNTTPISIVFSEPMSTEVTKNAISFAPEISGPISYDWTSDNKCLTIKTPFTYFESYSMAISQKAESISGSHLQEPFILVFDITANPAEKPTENPGNTPQDPEIPSENPTLTRPQIISINPTNFSENIELSENIKVVFSNPMNQKSVENAITIFSNKNEDYTKNWLDNKTLIISPIKSWLPGATYKIDISSSCCDTEDLHLASDFTSHFKTLRLPTAELIDPQNLEENVSLDSQITLNFSKEMNTASVESSILVQPSNKLNFTWTNSNKSLTISNSTQWPENSNIRVVLNNLSKDINNIPLANPQSYVFKTILIPTILASKCEPIDNAVATPLNVIIKTEFNKELNQQSVEKCFSLTEINSTSAIKGKFNWSSKIMTFTPAEELKPNTTYIVTLRQEYYDLKGNKATTGYSWQFTTLKSSEGENQSLLFAQNNDISTFTPRIDHTLTTFANKIWLIGGKSMSGEPLNDIYASSDGINWQTVSEKAPFSPRFGHSCTVFNNKLWLSGGITIDENYGVAYLNDVWNTSDGLHWNKVADIAETTNYESETRFSKRAYHNMISYKDKLWVMLGENSEGKPIGDIWSSSDGITWNDRSNIDLPRKKATAIIFKDPQDNNYESIFVIGGYGNNLNNTEEPLRELIVFKDKATNWNKKSSSLDFEPRYSSSSVVFNDRIWLIGGKTSLDYTNEILASNDGLNWVHIPNKNDGFTQRAAHKAVTFKEQIIISGGENTDNTYNEIWSIK